MTPEGLAEGMEATWPPARKLRLGPWWLREGAGGGQRVSAASPAGDWDAADIPQAEAAMLAMGQTRLWVIHDDARLDAALAARGYRRHDPVVAYAAPVAALAGEVSGMAGFAHWPPLAIACDIWAEGGIGPERLAVMQRVAGAKSAILGRTADTPAGAAFVAIHGDLAMLHALEVRPALRRQGSARNILMTAAHWAQDQGAVTFSLVVTEQNAAARALYERLGMVAVGRYHYRVM
ncbi:MAG: GNAT family N-acetyltransferase [Gemmobacter sp.]|uniref:GNAT family N-acetyltransferase n=1 Tax=Gemmobacter sp. TaxID=1898957 RepID=UPI001A460E47|nr:GNAT family N-acetyltransferase [Gemmobacter sp.]MBL8561134.1 GNAT family N-acetyltransferase [Gemmobacter sp.]